MPDAFHTPEPHSGIAKAEAINARAQAALRKHRHIEKLALTLCMSALMLMGVLALQEADRVMKREALINQENYAWNR